MNDFLCQYLVYCGSTSVQAFTGAVPFDGIPDVSAMYEIISGERPARPHHPIFTNRLWKLMQNCWDQDPHLRPGVPEVLSDLYGM